MSLYKSFFPSLKENTDEVCLLGVLYTKGTHAGTVEYKIVSDDNERHPIKWQEIGTTFRYLPFGKLLNFAAIPSKENAQSIKNWLEEKGYTISYVSWPRYYQKFKPDSTEMDRKKRLTSDSVIVKSESKYCAILLDLDSREKLKAVFSKFIPSTWEIKCHHMTIDPFNEINDPALIGSSVNLIVTFVGMNDRVSAVKVSGYRGITKNAFPHVTLAVNTANGGQSKDSSNEIKEWHPVYDHVTLTGTIENL